MPNDTSTPEDIPELEAEVVSVRADRQVRRDGRGRFLKGSAKPNGSGTPRKLKPNYVRYLYQELTPKRWQAIILRAIHDAVEGRDSARSAAREWLGKYAIGLPRPQADDSDTIDASGPARALREAGMDGVRRLIEEGKL
jgi:hypothetical protein